MKKHNVRRTFRRILFVIVAAVIVAFAAICGAAAGRGYVSSSERVRVAYNAIASGTPYHVAAEALSRDECANLDGLLNKRPIRIYINEEI